MRTLLAAALLLPLPAVAADVHQLTWDITVGDHKVGARRATVTIEDVDGHRTRTVEAYTAVDATVGATPYTWKQRLTIVGGDDPASFTSVIDDNGARELVQAGWTGDGWRVTRGDKRGVHTETAAAHRIDLSTADLLDPGSHWRLSSYPSIKVLSAETGDIWEGPVAPLGPSTVQIAGEPVEVQGWSWSSPEGAQTWWYDADGWLVRFEARLFGQVVAGTLTQRPPRSPDGFQVDVAPGPVESTDL
jgi:hypothetical protein